MSEIIYRYATPDDASQLVNIYSYYVKNTAITFEYDVPSVQEFRERISKTLEKYPYLVAETEGKIVAYAYAGAFKTRRAYDWAVEVSIYVSRDFHNHGIGHTLYEKLFLILKQMNITNVNACITYKEIEDEFLTHRSPQFHEKMGFKLVGRFNQCGYKFKRWYDMIWMEKIIGQHQENQPEVIKFPDLV